MSVGYVIMPIAIPAFMLQLSFPGHNSAKKVGNHPLKSSMMKTRTGGDGDEMDGMYW